MTNSLLPWYALILPLLSAATITLFTRRAKTLSAFISVAAVLASFICSCLIFAEPEISAPELTTGLIFTAPSPSRSDLFSIH